MAAPTIVRSGGASSGNSTSSINVSLGGAATAGNLILILFAADKSIANMTPSGTGWNSGITIQGTSVSVFARWKVAAGGENSITCTTSATMASGGTAWIVELSQTGSDSWAVQAQSSATYSDTAVTSKALPTTDTADWDALAFAAIGIDSASNGPTTAGWSNGYTARWTTAKTPAGTDGGCGGLYTASASVVQGATTSTTFTNTGGASDQLSGFIIALGRSGLPGTAPTVDAGADATVDQFDTFTRTGTEPSDGGLTITSRAWTVQSGPAYVGTTIGTAAALSWEPETPGSYVLRYSATNSAGTGTNDLSLTVDTVFHARTANVVLAGTQSTIVHKSGVTGAANLPLQGSSTGSKIVQGLRSINIRLAGSASGHKINVGAAHLILHGVLSAEGRPGAGSATALVHIHGSSTGVGHRFATRTANVRVFGDRVAQKRIPGSRTANLILHASRGTPFKNIPGAFNAPMVLHATRSSYIHRTSVAITANIRLAGSLSGRFSVRGDPQHAFLVLHGTPSATSIRFNIPYSASLSLSALVFGFRVVLEVNVAVRAKADTTTKYELVCVARIPQAFGPPVLIEVDPIKTTGIGYTEELNKPTALSVTAKFSETTEPVLQRLRNPDELPSELWLYRNGKRVFAGPLLGANASGNESISMEAQDILAYTARFLIQKDLIYGGAGTEQFKIVKDMIDQWQALEYGHFGIVTDDIPPSGIVRMVSYLYKELNFVDKEIGKLSLLADGFDFSVDPVTRRIQLDSPRRGTDRSIGEDAIVFDSRNVSSNDVTFSIGPSDLASEGYGTSGKSDESTLISTKPNLELRTRYGRTAYAASYDKVTTQEELDGYTQASVDARAQTLYIPGPKARVTPDADLNDYEVGDVVSYAMHNRLNAVGSFRIRKRVVDVDDTGQEAVSVEFV